MVFDEKAQVNLEEKKEKLMGYLQLVTQEWKPRWGYKRIEDPKDDWVLEVPDNAGERT